MSTNYDPENFKPGEMDISAQEAAFEGTVKVIVGVTVGTIAVCIFLLLVAV